MINKILTYYTLKIAILFGVAFFVSCENNIDDVNKYGKQEIKPHLEIWDFVREDTDLGKPVMSLSAPYMKSYEKDSTIYLFPKGFTLKTFNYVEGQKIVENTITADSARYVQGFRLDAFKNVVVQNIKNEELRTNFLSWDEKKEIIHTHLPVEIIQNGQKLHGVGFEAKQDFSYFNINKSTGNIKIDDK